MSLKSLSSALALLDYFTPETPYWGVRGLAKACGQHPAVVQRILATYAEHGFLLRLSTPRPKYSLGMRFYQLGNMVIGATTFIDAVKPVLQKLALSSGETAYLTWLSHDDCICIAIGESPNSIQLRVTVGSHMPLYAGAAAKAILAFLPSARFDAWLLRQRSDTAWNGASLQQECTAIRQAGFAYTRGEWVSESFGLALPIMGPEAMPFGSLALAGPAYRFDEQRIPERINEMKQAQEQICWALSHVTRGDG
ncbi:IclR family transcriptional regulator [Serratia quinivorans]|uniref:IclR family transcriptional regulator n=1 Tax=Serratia quinivorans TaxID=137545 RepID=UPI002178CB77|nr:IclR family transcriptional regulator [Serratia quinivorans]CAI0994460.1 Acetate operon repressor [Serratia quinivorans]CAI1738862.1 Acetate operon repressor [Serratia quinivorans]CAI1794663.1 Acetate operon repressor [Serratia quinivorans]